MTLPTTNRRCLGGAALALSLLGGSVASADTIFVSTCGNDAWTGVNSFCMAPVGPKRTIQAALDAAFDGDEIRVTAGTYSGPIDFDGRAVRLVGLAGPDLTTIDGHGSGPVVLCASGEGPDTILEGFTITGGHATNDSGGGMVCLGTSPTIDHCVFADNAADISGGGLLIVSGAPALQACNFIGNTANQFGGGVLCLGGSPTINACRFEDNAASTGGGLAIQDGASASITWTWFDSNIAGLFGGGLATRDSSAYIGLCSFVDNRAWLGGGALAHLGGSDMTLEGAFFQANESTGGSGGAFYQSQGSSTLDTCTFDANVAHESGGALWLHVGGDIRATDCTFTANTAIGGGGAIGHVTGILIMRGAQFTANTSMASGGAIWSRSGTVVLANSRLVANEAVIGGAIASVDTGGNFLVANTLLRDNRAERGGAIYDAENDDMRIVNCTVVKNVAVEAAALLADGDPQVSNTIIWDHNDPISGSGRPTIRHSVIEGGWPGAGNLDSDPDFIDPAAANYRLDVASPCVDAGLSHAVPADRPDLDDDGNDRERLPFDLDGQPRFMDAASPDSGCGTGLLVDIGAFEVAGASGGDVVVGDINEDGVVDFEDLLAILDAWGPCPGCCPADLDLDGVVDFNDLLVVLSGWDH